MDRTSVVVRDDSYRQAMRLVDVGGRLVELHIRRSKRVNGHRLYVRQGLPPELVVRPRAGPTRTSTTQSRCTCRGWSASSRVSPSRVSDSSACTLTEQQGRREAHARILLIAQSEAAALGVSYTRLTLRDQRSRWGSCSSKGALSFNWRLVLAPHDVLDYVVVHEVCHLAEHHHGPAFWQLVARAGRSTSNRRTGWTRTAGRCSRTGRHSKPLLNMTAWSAGRASTVTAR
jgi:hypothetical protein